MTRQLVLLLLVALFVSLPAVVFADAPLSAVPPEEVSQVASTPEAVIKKNWEGPLIGLGLGLGLGGVSVEYQGESADSPVTGSLPVRARLGYGFLDRTVLYGSVTSFRNLSSDVPRAFRWSEIALGLGMMHRGRYDSSYYWFYSLGATFEGDPRPIYIVAGSGYEVSPGLSGEGTGTLEYFSYEGVSFTTVIFDLTFNYHFY